MADSCKISGPYLPIGDDDPYCNTHQVYLAGPICPVGGGEYLTLAQRRGERDRPAEDCGCLHYGGRMIAVCSIHSGEGDRPAETHEFVDGYKFLGRDRCSRIYHAGGDLYPECAKPADHPIHSGEGGRG